MLLHLLRIILNNYTKKEKKNMNSDPFLSNKHDSEIIGIQKTDLKISASMRIVLSQVLN